MSVISGKFNLEIDALKREFESNKSINHQGTKGSFNENGLIELIQKVIPRKFIVTKGTIENSEGAQSNQTDIIIYDDEILPLYMKQDVAFVPIEAVKYIFEVKSTLNSTELKSTIDKFEHFKAMGGNSPRVLFAFVSDIKGSEIERLKNNDKNFYTNSSITVFCTSNKSYYYKTFDEYYFKDFISNAKFLDLIWNKDNADLNKDVSINFIPQDIEDMEDRELNINGLKYSDIKFRIYKWIGVEAGGNEVELSLLSGISNTLCKGSFGSYLLRSSKQNLKIVAVCYEDMWGNISSQDFNENGLDYDVNDFSFKFTSTGSSNKITFTPKGLLKD